MGCANRDAGSGLARVRDGETLLLGGRGGGFILGDPTLTLGTKRTKILNFRDLRDLTLP